MAANAPILILVADGRAPGEVIISNNATVYEFNPWEMGSFDPTVYGFAPMRYVGSNFPAGVLPNDQKCIEGFDNTGFVMGTSSSLFNQFILDLNTTIGVPDVVKNDLASILTVKPATTLRTGLRIPSITFTTTRIRMHGASV